jgi:hypothetical protein
VPVFEDILSTLEAQSAKIDALAAEVAQLRAKVEPAQEIYSLRDLAELPGSPSLSSLRNRPELQPHGGIPDGYRGSLKSWYRETVESWRRQLSPGPDVPPRLGLHKAAS